MVDCAPSHAHAFVPECSVVYLYRTDYSGRPNTRGNVLLHHVCEGEPSWYSTSCPTPSKPTPPPQRSREPKTCAGFIHKPLCDAWEQAANPRPKAPQVPSPLLSDPKQQFCLDQDSSDF